MAPTTPEGKRAAGDARRAPDDTPPTTPLSVRVSPDQRAALAARADDEGVTVTEIVQRAIAAELSD